MSIMDMEINSQQNSDIIQNSDLRPSSFLRDFSLDAQIFAEDEGGGAPPTVFDINFAPNLNFNSNTNETYKTVQEKGDGHAEDRALQAGREERRKRRRERYERDQQSRRRWELRQCLGNISADVEGVAKEVAKLHKQVHVPLPPASKLPEHERKSVEAARDRRLLEILSSHCKKTLQAIMAHKWSWPFNSPVDTNIYHDYLDKVKTPIDFGTIKRRLDRGGQYRHPDEFLADVRLVFDNARTYNKPGSDVYVMANTLQEKFEDRYTLSVIPRTAEVLGAYDAELLAARQRYALAASDDGTESKLSQCTALINQIDTLMSSIADAKSAAAAQCFPLKRTEKEKLAEDLGRLNQAQFESVIGIVMRNYPGLQALKEIGINLNLLDALTLRQMQSYVAAAMETSKKELTWPNLPSGFGQALEKEPRTKSVPVTAMPKTNDKPEDAEGKEADEQSPNNEGAKATALESSAPGAQHDVMENENNA
jgi:hypothetical protein